MPTFTQETRQSLGHSAKEPVKIFQEPGIKAWDTTHGGSDIKVANRKIIVTTLRKSLRFDVNVNCFDINAR
jgi:hypothetical protein